MLRESEWGGKRHAAMPGEGLAIRSLNGSFSKDQKVSQHCRSRGRR